MKNIIISFQDKFKTIVLFYLYFIDISLLLFVLFQCLLIFAPSNPTLKMFNWFFFWTSNVYLLLFPWLIIFIIDSFIFQSHDYLRFALNFFMEWNIYDNFWNNVIVSTVISIAIYFLSRAVFEISFRK